MARRNVFHSRLEWTTADSYCRFREKYKNRSIPTHSISEKMTSPNRRLR